MIVGDRVSGDGRVLGDGRVWSWMIVFLGVDVCDRR